MEKTKTIDDLAKKYTEALVNLQKRAKTISKLQEDVSILKTKLHEMAS